MKKIAILTLFAFLGSLSGPNAFAAKIGEDTLIIGKPGSSAEKKVQLGTTSQGVIKYDPNDSKLKFAHDGSTFKAIGSGSGGGGGITLLGDVNADFEAGSGNWTASGGSFTIDSTTQLFDAKSGVFNASAASQTLTQTAVAIPVGMRSGSGFASCYFKTAATDYKIQVTDGTNVLSERTIPALSAAQEIGIAFPFPSSGNVQLRVISASDAADLTIDNCYLGTMKQGPVSQATLLGGVEITGASCSWSTTSGTYADLTQSGTCGRTHYGQAVTAGSNVPGFNLASLPPGEYLVTTNGRTSCNGTGELCNFSVSHDGSTDSFLFSLGNNATGQTILTGASGSTRFSVSTAISNAMIRVRAMKESAATSASINADGSGRPFRLFLYRFPTSQEQVFRPDQVAWRVDANISGANPSLGTFVQSSYGPIAHGSLTLTQNPGSIGTQIACASGTASSGTTCSGADEHVGIAFTVPTAVDALACASFSHSINRATNGFVDAAFQIVETSNTATTILQEGKTRIQSYADGPTAGNVAVTNPLRVCGTFVFSSAGQKTLRLMYEQNTGATINSNLILADAAGAQGQRDIHWEVYPISQAIPAPLLVNSVTSSSAGIERVERASAAPNCSSSPCTLASKSPGVSSVVRNGVGDYTINFVSGTFSATPTCVCKAVGSSLRTTCGQANPGVSSATVSNFETFRLDSSANSDSGFEVICMGPR